MQEVERHLTGQETEPWEMLYFKMYRSQLTVIAVIFSPESVPT